MSPARLAALASFAARVTVEPDDAHYEAICVDRDAVYGWPKAAEDDEACLMRDIGSACIAFKVEPSVANAEALAALVKRVSVLEDDGEVAIAVDGNNIYSGDGPETTVLHAFGALCAAVNAEAVI